VRWVKLLFVIPFKLCVFSFGVLFRSYLLSLVIPKNEEFVLIRFYLSIDFVRESDVI
jgi:hypothetical protein